MKRIAVVLFCFVAATLASAQTASVAHGPVINWDNPTHDFGDIYQGDKVEHSFKFTNTGSEPLIITNVEVTCGCTVPKGWPRDPVAPGADAEINIQFDSTGKYGKQNKVVKIISNASSGTNQVLFTTNVLEKKLPNR